MMRRANAADAAAIAELTRRAYAKWVELIGREPLPMQVDYAEALTRHRFDLIERDGRLFGLMETVADGDFLLVVNVAVDPAAQKQGLGEELLRMAERIAGEMFGRLEIGEGEQLDGIGLADLLQGPAHARVARQALATIGRSIESGDGDGHGAQLLFGETRPKYTPSGSRTLITHSPPGTCSGPQITLPPPASTLACACVISVTRK